MSKLHLAILALLPFLLAADWLQFRGSENNPVATDAKLLTEFSPDEGVAWKVPVPGRGVSGPIVVGKRVIVTASSGPVHEDRLHVLAYDAASGKELWHRQVWATGRPFHHPTSANAAPTPASDGQRIFAFFSSNDLVCLDLDGNLLWYRGLGHDYPKAGNDVGMASSPLVVGDTVVVQVESQGDSFAAGLDVASGQNRWRIDRPHAANWVSPAILKTADGKSAALLQSADGITAHDPKSGEQLWKFDAKCAGIPSLMTAGGRIFIPAAGITALETTSAGTSPSLLWESNKLGLGNSSPIVHGGRVYALNKAGVLVCGDEQDGDVAWQLRLKGTFWATPLIAGEHLYACNQDGQCLVVKLGKREGELVHSAELGEPFFGSPAADAAGLYLRGAKHLWKIGE
ncbi:MAG: PQQ-like beta-propeller repeat protein [Planctomycetaceae bacterium]|nr:PQQ-like beta-propeller repeat protein [Planctomycetaceae bacterium]